MTFKRARIEQISREEGFNYRRTVPNSDLRPMRTEHSSGSEHRDKTEDTMKEKTHSLARWAELL